MDKDITQVCPFYLDLQGEGQRIQVTISLSPNMMAFTTHVVFHELSSLSPVATLDAYETRHDCLHGPSETKSHRIASVDSSKTAQVAPAPHGTRSDGGVHAGDRGQAAEHQCDDDAADDQAWAPAPASDCRAGAAGHRGAEPGGAAGRSGARRPAPHVRTCLLRYTKAFVVKSVVAE